MKKILWLFLASLFICINLVKPREKISLNIPEFQNELNLAVNMQPGSEKIKKYEQLREQAIKLGQQKSFMESLQKWVDNRQNSEVKPLSDFINFTAYNPDFSNFRDKLKKLADRAKQFIIYSEKIDRLTAMINKAQLSTEKKEKFLTNKDVVIKEMGELFKERGGKSAEEITKLQGLFNAAKFSNLFEDAKDVKLLDFWIKNVSIQPSVDERVIYIWQEIQSGVASENSEAFFKKLTSFLEEVDAAYRAGKLKMAFNLLPKILNAVAYSSAFTKVQQDQAAKWLKEVEEAMRSKIGDEKITYAQRLDKLTELVLEPDTFLDNNKRNYFFEYLQNLVDTRMVATLEEIAKLQSSISFVKWNESLAPDQKDKLINFFELSKTAASYVDMVNKLMIELSRVSQDPAKKEEFLSKINSLTNSFVASKVADKKPTGQDEIINLLNFAKANPIFSDKATADKIDKMISDIKSAVPGKTPEKVKEEKKKEEAKPVPARPGRRRR
ncbi:MAG: hypothetical protein WC436_04750 [Candidatus Babeliales bacterium]